MQRRSFYQGASGSFNRSGSSVNNESKDAHNEVQDDDMNDEDVDEFRFDGEGQQFIQQRFSHLARSFRERAQRVRKRFDLPPTPSTISSEAEDANNIIHNTPAKKSTITEAVSQEWEATEGEAIGCVIQPQSCLYVAWLSLVTFSYMYNCFVIPLRATFPYQNKNNTIIWLIMDYSMDAIYLLDILLVKPRIMYLEDGFWVRDVKRTRQNYVRKVEFKMDLLSLTPRDLLYFYIGPSQCPRCSLLRVPRLLKIHSFWEFFNHFDKVSPSPYIVRIARTLTYMIYLVHMNACAYYAVSEKEGLGTNHWVYNNTGGNAYIRCFYFAVKTATSIGKNPRPENELEYLFMTASWLMGVFVFALLIGQIRDIIASATQAQTEYRKLKDETLHHLRKLNLPPKLIERVKTWFSYTWQQSHTLDEGHLLDTLPHKMKTDVAINVHIQTLNKVQLFKDCDEALLRELVLKLRPVLFLPGDYICRKGEVGREMYIVKSGQVQVVSGDNGSEVLATLTEGSVFGEISLLSITGGNRRTADVRSNGFSNLFVLSKDDLNEALVFHPNAQEILRRKARQLMKQNAAREKKAKAEVLIKNPEKKNTPRLIPIVMKLLPPDSSSARALLHGSKYAPKYRTRRLNTTHNGLIRREFSSPKKVLSRCHSVDLGGLGSSWTSCLNHKTNTFECNVTVHREMSK